MIKESAIVAYFAIETHPDTGYQLIPKDPLEAAEMRVKIEDLGNNLQLQFGVYMSRGEDPKKNKALTQLLKD